MSTVNKSSKVVARKNQHLVGSSEDGEVTQRSSLGTGTYKYEALKAEEIRVLYILSTQDPDGPVECEMKTVKAVTDTSRSTWPSNPYCTMSYAWGETFSDGSHLTDEIRCDGKRLSVTRHLCNGLKRFRAFQRHGDPAFRKQALWVDGVCINQDDDGEKSLQVQMIGQVFQSSTAMIVWLGELEGDHENASLRSFCETTRLWPASRGTTDRTEALSIIMSRSWFERRWVVQEVNLLSRFSFLNTVLIGAHNFELKVLNRHVNALSDRDMQLHFRKLDRVGAQLSRFYGQELRTFLQCMLWHEGTKYSNEHDIIYALMHSYRDINRFGIVVDYAKPIEDWFYHIAKVIIETPTSPSESLFLLTLATAHSSRSQHPSWVPNWSGGYEVWSKEHQDAVEWLARLEFADRLHDRFPKLVCPCNVDGPLLTTNAGLSEWSQGITIQHPWCSPDFRDESYIASQPFPPHPVCEGRCSTSESWKSLLEEGAINDWVLLTLLGTDSNVKFVARRTSDLLPGSTLPLYELLFCIHCDPVYPVESKGPIAIAIG